MREHRELEKQREGEVRRAAAHTRSFRELLWGHLVEACRLCVARAPQEKKKKENTDRLLTGDAKKPLRTGFDPLPTEPGARIFQACSVVSSAARATDCIGTTA